MSLPPHVDRMIGSILAVRPDTAIVVQSGTPVAMPWADRAAAIVQMWFGGNEGGNGLADVLFGDVNPVGLQSLKCMTSTTNGKTTEWKAADDISKKDSGQSCLSSRVQQ